MIYWRQRHTGAVLFHLLEILLLGTIRWRTSRFVWDLDAPLPYTAAIALRMPTKRNHATSKKASTNVQSICDCGSVVVDVSVGQDGNSVGAINCHCTGCRRYHTGPFTSFLSTDISHIFIHQGKEKIGKFNTNCNELGRVERWFCVDCSSKIITIQKSLSTHSTDDGMTGEENGSRNSQTIDLDVNSCHSQGMSKSEAKCFVNLGPVVEDGIPSTRASAWKEQLQRDENNLHFDEKNGAWVRARSEDILDDDSDVESFSPPLQWSGGCSCGACKYELILEYPTELQHCYCNLCRRLSGSPFMSWIPVEKDYFRWQPSPSLEIVRTTPFGRRHICSNCKSVMTIVYDEQPDLIWPCAGSLDDSSLPNDTTEMAKCFSRVCHICCRHHPTWLEVQNDGLDRIDDAS